MWDVVRPKKTTNRTVRRLEWLLRSNDDVVCRLLPVQELWWAIWPDFGGARSLPGICPLELPMSTTLQGLTPFVVKRSRKIVGEKSKLGGAKELGPPRLASPPCYQLARTAN